MVYATSDMLGKWIILQGWHGCQAGQGTVLESNVDESRLNETIEKYNKPINTDKK